jgi:hypothetical protein
MKAVYVGSVRGYQPPVYRPGMGWTSSGSDRRIGRGPAVFAHRRTSGFGPFSMAGRRRTSLKTKVAIVAMIVTIVALLWLVFGGQI